MTNSRMDELQDKMAEIQAEIKAERDRPKYDIAAKLQQIRKRNTKFTQTDMSEKLGLSRTQYTNMETGVGWITVKNLIAVCLILKTTPNEVLGFKDE